MKVWLTVGERRYAARVPFREARWVEVDDSWFCPRCRCMDVRGSPGPTRGYDTYTTDALCMKCGAVAGELEVKVETLFGIEEDERVLYGRARVYG